MSFQAGNIKYDIEVSTVDLLKAEAIVDKSLEKQTQSFVQADKAVRDYEKTQRDLGRTIGQTGIVFNKNGKVLVEQTNQYRALTAQAMSTHENLTALGGGVSRLADGVRRGNIDMTNMSYQLQDIAVQAQMGINPFMIAAQQVPQMLVGMGAVAAGIGAAVAIAGGLALAFIDTRTEVEKLEAQVESVKAVITLSAAGVANYSDEMLRLAKISEQLSKVKLTLALKEQEQAIKQTAVAMRDEWGKQGSFYSNTNLTIAKTLKVSVAAIEEFDKAVRAVGITPTVESMKQLENALAGLQQAGGMATEDGRKLIGTTADLILKFNEGKLTADALKLAIEGVVDVSNNVGEKFSQIIQSLSLQNAELVHGERSAYAMALKMEGLTDAQVNAAMAIYDANKALEDQREKLKNADDGLAEFEQSLREFQEEQRRLANLGKSVQTIGLTDEEAIRERYRKQLDMLREAEAAGLEVKGEYSERYKELKRQEAEELASLTQEQENWFTKSMEAMENQAIGAFTQFVTGAKSGKEAIHDLAKSILTQMIGAIVKQGIAAITTSNTTTAAISANNTTIAASAAPAAASMSLATAGGNSVGAISGIAATSAAMLALMAIGGRESGGAVSAGSMYRVGEKGPEMFRTRSGQNYMIPGESGQVINNRNSFGGGVGGGVNWTIQVNNNAPAKAYATVDDVNRIVKVEVSDLSNQVQNNAGPFYRSLTQATNVRGRNG